MKKVIRLTESELISLVKKVINESDPKIGTGKKPKGSSRRLYTDENPSDTVSVKFKTKEDIVDTLNKESFKSKPHKRQSQIINLIHQRVRAAYQNAKDPEVKKRLRTAFEYIETVKEKSKQKTIRIQKQKVNESETKTNSVLHRLLNMLFEGFIDMYYDWAEFNCGMGVCCDPYAIGFTLPISHHHSDWWNPIFKLVDEKHYDDDGDYEEEISLEMPKVCYDVPDIKNPNFDTIVFYKEYTEQIEDYMGHESNWKSDLLKIINEQFGCEAKRIVII